MPTLAQLPLVAALFVLEPFYVNDNTGWGAQAKLAELYGSTRKTALQKRARALERLSRGLFDYKLLQIYIL